MEPRPREHAVDDLAVGGIEPYAHPRGRPPAPTTPTTRRLLVQEVVRSLFAGILALCLLGTIIGAFIGIYTGHWTETRELLDIVLPVLGALLGSVATFYFIERRDKD